MTIHVGDCIEVMATMPADSVDAVVTDPPYALTTIGRTLHMTLNPSRKDYGTNQRRTSGGFMGKNWDAPDDGTPRGFQAWCQEWGREALRVTKPGGYLLAFGGTRTHHRLVCGLEDAGWIIRDELDWIYASGFPKGKANLKPAHEPIVLARKPGPLRPLGIDECRIEYAGPADFEATVSEQSGPRSWKRVKTESTSIDLPPTGGVSANLSGRWPSNLLLSDPELFDEPNPAIVGSGSTSADGTAVNARRDGVTDNGVTYGYFPHQPGPDAGYGGAGGYSRFFIIPKADRSDREPIVRGQLDKADAAAMQGNRKTGGRLAGDGRANPEIKAVFRENAHPTVKPTDLMRHLVRLVTPSGGTVLDCFAGSGSTILACELEGFPWIAIEQSAEYVEIMRARLNGTQRGLGLDVPAPNVVRSPSKGHWSDPETGSPSFGDTGFTKGKRSWRVRQQQSPDEEPAA